jgi:SAM-dependent methyltransferase
MTVVSPITGNTSAKLIDKIPVDRIIALYKRDLNIDVSAYFQGLTNVEVYECNETKFRFFYPLSLAGRSDFYEQLSSGNDIYYPQWKWENEIALKYIPDGVRLLDIGCGEGIFLKGLSERRKVKAMGLELNPDALKRCAEKGLTVRDITIQDFVTGNEAAFDVVTTFQVVEHIAAIGSFLEAKLKVLRPGGTMIIGVPYSNPYLYGKDKYDTLNLPPHHMGLWNEHAFKNLETLFNIKLKAVHTSRLHDMLYYFSVQMNCREKYNRLFWSNRTARFIFRSVNKLLSPFRYFLKGHDIIVIFEKNEK